MEKANAKANASGECEWRPATCDLCALCDLRPATMPQDGATHTIYHH
jgi:hypothetical protein